MTVLLASTSTVGQPVPLFRTLYSFTNGVDGGNPYAAPIVSGCTLYGTALGGGANSNGTVFSISTNGQAFKVLHSFGELYPPPSPMDHSQTNGDGAGPYAGLVMAGDTLFGTAFDGGFYGFGTVFGVKCDGTGFATLHSFNQHDGQGPMVSLLVSGTTLYGTTEPGFHLFALNGDASGFTNLYEFDTGFPIELANSPVVQSGDALYGTGQQGGSNGYGSVYVIETNGSGFSSLHDFSGPDGESPSGGGLVLSGDSLYGAAAYGGTNGNTGTLFAVNTDGTGFRVLHTFSGFDGETPYGAMIVSGNTLFGVTLAGGVAGGHGTVFAIHTDGTGFTTLHSFSGGSDGTLPYGGVTLAGNTLFGTTWAGGDGGYGTVYAITLAPAPAIDPNSLTVVGGQLQFTVTGVAPGATVYLQTSSDPSGTAIWVPVSTNVAAGTNLTMTGLTATNAPYGFFRVVETFLP